MLVEGVGFFSSLGDTAPIRTCTCSNRKILSGCRCLLGFMHCHHIAIFPFLFIPSGE